MRIFWKYFLSLLTLLIIVLFYFISTKSGNKDLKYLIGNYLSKETSNKIVVHSLDLDKYPYIIIKLEINHKSKMTLKGKITPYSTNMEFYLKGDSFKFDNFYLKDKIDIRGKFWGSFSYLHIRGDGYIFGGYTKYHLVNTPKNIEDFNITMKKVDIRKISYFLEQKPFINGLVDITFSLHSSSRSVTASGSTVEKTVKCQSQLAQRLPVVSFQLVSRRRGEHGPLVPVMISRR